MQNVELQNLITALGCGVAPDTPRSGLRYHKVSSSTDADYDGHHISTLILTFFYRHMPSLIRNAHVYLAAPPLYASRRASRPSGPRTTWRRQIIAGLPRIVNPDVRAQGPGEMRAAKRPRWTSSGGTVFKVFIDNELEERTRCSTS